MRRSGGSPCGVGHLVRHRAGGYASSTTGRAWVGPGLPPGREGARQLFEAMFAGFPDFRYEIDDDLVDGDKLIWGGRFTGTHRGEFLSIQATGRRIDVKVIDIIRYADGKAAEH